MTSPILVLTGPTASGKNSVAKALSEDIQPCAVVDFDLIRAMFVNPHLAPWDGTLGKDQQYLGVHIVSDIARSFANQSYHVIILDVLESDTLPIYEARLEGYNLQVIQLLPEFEENRRRFLTRGRCLTDEQFKMVYQQQQDFKGFHERFDNSRLSADQVAERILNRYKKKGQSN